MTPDQLPVRVTLRRRLADGRLTDVLGMLELWADGLLVMRRRDGHRVAVHEADVIAVKRIPPPPARR